MAHSTLLELGFLCLSASDADVENVNPKEALLGLVAPTEGGGINLRILPPAWRGSNSNYSFMYVHPKLTGELVTMKARRTPLDLSLVPVSRLVGNSDTSLTHSADHVFCKGFSGLTSFHVSMDRLLFFMFVSLLLLPFVFFRSGSLKITLTGTNFHVFWTDVLPASQSQDQFRLAMRSEKHALQSK